MMRANKNRLMKYYIDYNLSGLLSISVKFIGTSFTTIVNLTYITMSCDSGRIRTLNTKTRILMFYPLNYRAISGYKT